MIGDPDQVIVTTGGISRPTAFATHVHHRGFPEIEVEGPSTLEAAEALLRRLAAALDDTPNHWHRGELEQARDDVRAFVARGRRSGARRRASTSREPSPRDPS
jgi:hypothetical protein